MAYYNRIAYDKERFLKDINDYCGEFISDYDVEAMWEYVNTFDINWVNLDPYDFNCLLIMFDKRS